MNAETEKAVKEFSQRLDRWLLKTIDERLADNARAFAALVPGEGTAEATERLDKDRTTLLRARSKMFEPIPPAECCDMCEHEHAGTPQ